MQAQHLKTASNAVKRHRIRATSASLGRYDTLESQSALIKADLT
jgi:hypothetical protein